jgi:hypothetical protein
MFTPDNGTSVTVNYDPNFNDHLEFNGPISETGYKSDFSMTRFPP